MFIVKSPDVYIYIYIYIERDIYMYVIYIYIYIYIERERERISLSSIWRALPLHEVEDARGLSGALACC